MAFGKTVLVTGANRGIGLELVKQLLKQPNRPEIIFATCRSPDGATDLKRIAEENKCVQIIKLDVGNLDDVKSAFETVKGHVGDKGLNVLINNAGILHLEGRLQDVTPEVMMESYRINTIAPTMIIKEFLPLLQQAAKNESSKPMSCARAAVLNMSGKIGSIDDNSSGRNYSQRCSKIALNMMNKNLSIELKSDGILAVVLHPGWVKTDMGGGFAITSTTECVEGLLRVAEGLGEKDNGLFYDFKGKLIPW
ncbi:C-signal-like isoform X1 [Rhopilema esculentum]|uniref:C-signal-like isoform X1 n=1 Tax=Rhopilema esculentum TaxID=499914 RepID=UPI0031D92F8E|eukprot:gene7141-12794_t